MFPEQIKKFVIESNKEKQIKKDAEAKKAKYDANSTVSPPGKPLANHTKTGS